MSKIETSAKKLLICEDEPELRSIYSELAEQEGWLVTACEDGQAGLEATLHQSFNLILSDVKMPRLTGLEFLKHFRSRDSDTPFFILTAFHDISEHQIYLLKGQGILYKPISAETLGDFFRNS